MRRSTVLALVSALALNLLGGALVAQTSAQVALESQLADLLNAGQIDQARALLARSPHDEADRLLLEGRILKLQGDYDAAVDVLDRALRLRSEDLAIRRELAHTQYLAGQYRPARLHLHRLERTDPNPELRTAYSQLRNRIDREQPLSFQFSFALEPSTNINRGTTNRYLDVNGNVLEIPASSQAQSGIGYRLGGSVTYRYPLNDIQGISLTLGANQTRYSVDNTLGRTGARITLGYDQVTQRHRFSVRPYYRIEDREDKDNRRAIGVALHGEYLLTGRHRLTANAVIERLRYRQFSQRNGTQSILTVGARYLLSSSLFLDYGVTLEDVGVGLPHNQYKGAALYGAVEKQLSSGLAITASARISQRRFDDVFPLTTRKREDDITVLTVSALNNRWNISGFTPRLTCRHEINASNISLHEFRTSSCEIGITQRF